MKFGSSGDLTCACANPLIENGDHCDRCGRKLNQERLQQIELKSKEQPPLSVPKYCFNCSKNLESGQNFCGNCGVEIQGAKVPTTKVFGTNNSKSSSSNGSKNRVIILLSVLGFLVLALFFSLGSQNSKQQDECFDREMSKFGAFADPKGWAVQSRLYCQSLYP